MTFTIEVTRDREGSEMYEVSVCENGEIIAQETFYDPIHAEIWVASAYPSAVEE